MELKTKQNKTLVALNFQLVNYQLHVAPDKKKLPTLTSIEKVSQSQERQKAITIHLNMLFLGISKRLFFHILHVLHTLVKSNFWKNAAVNSEEVNHFVGNSKQ